VDVDEGEEGEGAYADALLVLVVAGLAVRSCEGQPSCSRSITGRGMRGHADGASRERRGCKRGEGDGQACCEEGWELHDELIGEMIFWWMVRSGI
jgi:hypothetical protein